MLEVGAMNLVSIQNWPLRSVPYLVFESTSEYFRTDIFAAILIPLIHNVQYLNGFFLCQREISRNYTLDGNHVPSK